MVTGESTTVSLIATVKNEREHLNTWLRSIDAQTRLPDEIVIVDGGSTDGTWERLNDWRSLSSTVLVQVDGANISQGRNHAIDRSAGDIVVVTDAGTQVASHWIERIVSALDDDRIDVACGFFIPDAWTPWERSLAATTLPDAWEIDAPRFLPSSRSVAFRRTWWQGGVRYPEWLDFCEDVVWDLSLRRAGARFEFVPDAIVSFRVRPNPRAFWLQYFRYARGDGKAGLFTRRHVIRYVTWLAAAFVMRRGNPVELAAAIVLALGYCATPARRLWRRDRAADLSMNATFAALPLIPLQRAIGDIAKMMGYPCGLLWLTRRVAGIGSSSTWRNVSPTVTQHQPLNTAKGTPTPTSSLASESRATGR